MIDRRHLLAMLSSTLASPAFAQAPAMSKPTAYAYSFPGIDGQSIRLADYAGKPILVVNTASQCGYTPQFTGLQQLWARYHDRGLMIIGVPSNDFGGQEPGGPADQQSHQRDPGGVGAEGAVAEPENQSVSHHAGVSPECVQACPGERG